MYVGYGKVTHDGSWVFIEVDKSIRDYYCAVLNWLVAPVRPFDEPHITVVAGKYEQLPSYDIELGTVEFKYSDLFTDGNYYWLDAQCEWLHEFRVKNGLKPNLKYNPHITVGKYDKNWGKKTVKRPR
jgi:hypothetical protein